MNSITLSIALVTRNRPESLQIVLESISKQNVQLHEIVISDDSNDDESIRQNKVLADKYRCKYNSGPQRGLYCNRNFVAKLCTGSHIRTMDDDHEFPENHFIKCLEAINEEPEVIWTIGEYLQKHINRPLPSPIAGQLHPRGFSYLPNDMNEYYGISCGGTIYPREVIESENLNSEFYYFGIIYLEYGARLKKLGYTIKSLRSTYLIHNDQQTTATILTKQIINEAKIFAILCFSFSHQPTLKNKFLTVAQITLDFVTNKMSIKTFLSAVSNYKIFRKN